MIDLFYSIDWTLLLLFPWAFVFSPSCQCCATPGFGDHCNNVCNSGTTPSTWEVVISGMGSGVTAPCTGGADSCNLVNGTHTLTQDATDPCLWSKYIEGLGSCDWFIDIVLVKSSPTLVSFGVTIHKITYQVDYSKSLSLSSPVDCMDALEGVHTLSYVSKSGTFPCANETSLTVTAEAIA